MVFTAKIGKFDGVLSEVVFNSGDTVDTLLEKADLDVLEGQEINTQAGVRVLASTPAVNGEVYYITGNYKNGAN